MATLYTMDEWEICGKWYCGNISDLGNFSGFWAYPARMLDLTPAQYLKKVIEEFKPDNIFYSDDFSFVGWSWNKQSDMRKFKNWINKTARDKFFCI